MVSEAWAGKSEDRLHLPGSKAGLRGRGAGMQSLSGGLWTGLRPPHPRQDSQQTPKQLLPPTPQEARGVSHAVRLFRHYLSEVRCLWPKEGLLGARAPE